MLFRSLKDMLETSTRHFGGIDMVVLNAGIFPGGKTVSDLPLMSGVRSFQLI